MKPLLLALAAVVTAASTFPAAAAEPGEDALRRLNDSLVTHHVIPRYERLEAAAAGFAEEAAAFCASPDGPGLASLREAFHRGMDAWQGVQHLRFGPAELFMRSLRMGFWPDQRNATGRQMADLLAARDRADLEPRALIQGRVAAQGLPAVERLLFDDDAALPWPAGDDGAFRCDYLLAMARNMADIADAILAEWTAGPEAFRHTMSAAGTGDDPFYPSVQDATLDLFKSLVAAVEVVAERKLTRPMGESPDAARPRLAESWRSGRSLENIRRNLESAEDLYLGAGAHGFSDVVRDGIGERALDDLLRRAFAQTRETAEGIALPLRDAVSAPAMRPALDQLALEAAALRALLGRDLAPALGVPVGFNSLDGD